MMIECDDVRARLALGFDGDDRAAAAHLDSCTQCASYGRRNSALDSVLRSELLFDAPTALTNQLLALAAMPLGALPLPRPPRWYVVTVAILTTLAVIVSALLIVQGIGYVAAQVGLAGVPEQLWVQLTGWLSPYGDVGRAFGLVRDLAVSTLAAALLWLIFDRVRRPVVA